ncbi:bcl-2-like protein 12 [Betta splendens]|uniref:Bcl-2-like protein 12 n=1 Tax=Betta splendens TaxID=158456 RepID=A0A6P7NBM2_BETSP|nr:bcl-2-like protein 12 [Betta splendens]
MSVGRSSSTSSISSVSLLEIKTETHMVLQAFLQRVTSVPMKERPGRVGGAYKDHKKFSSKVQPRAKDVYDSQAEDVSSADEKKSSLKSFIKQLPRRNTSRRSTKEPTGSLGRDSKSKVSNKLTEDAAASPSSASDEEDGEKKLQNRRKKIKKKLSQFFKIKLEKDAQGANPPRPSSLPLSKKTEPAPAVSSPTRPPKFYVEVAENLEKIAQKASNAKKSPVSPPPPAVEQRLDKEVVREQLFQLLSLEGDNINTKIEADPFLRSSLTRMSYASFAKLLDAFGSSELPAPPSQAPSASPTLQRMAVTMEVSRRIVTATGAQRMQGYAECYMETFVPWVKSRGGWENLQADMKDLAECD